MPLSPADYEAIARIFDEKIKALQRPLAEKVGNHSKQLRAVREEVPDPVKRALRDSRADIDDAEAGREQVLINAMAQFRQEVADKFAALEKTSSSAERAAQITEGKTTALIANSDTADAQRQKNSKKLTGSIVLQALTFGTAIAAIVERILHAGSP